MIFYFSWSIDGQQMCTFEEADFQTLIPEVNFGVGTFYTHSFSYDKNWYITGFIQEVIHMKIECLNVYALLMPC